MQVKFHLKPDEQGDMEMWLTSAPRPASASFRSGLSRVTSDVITHSPAASDLNWAAMP
jgi:hypothetical protein